MTEEPTTDTYLVQLISFHIVCLIYVGRTASSFNVCKAEHFMLRKKLNI